MIDLGENMKQILQSFKTGEMWLAEVPAQLGKRGRGMDNQYS